MRRDIEDGFRKAIVMGRAQGFSVRDVIGEMKRQGHIQSEKQAWRTLEKWIRRNEYEYGVNLELGWLTARGMSKL